MSLKEEIFAKAKELPRKEVPVAEWGCSVWIPKLTGAQGDEIAGDAAKRQRRNDFVGWRSYLIARCVQDDAGALIFDADSKDDLKNLQGMSNDSLEALSDEIMQYNNLGKKGLEDAEKN